MNHGPRAIHITLKYGDQIKTITKDIFENNYVVLPVMADNSGQSSSFSAINARCSKAAALIFVASLKYLNLLFN